MGVAREREALARWGSDAADAGVDAGVAGSSGAGGATVAIYNTTGSFMTAELIEAFVSWGGGSNFGSRESVAVQGEVWTNSERIEIQPGHAGFIATGAADRGAGYTSVPARCLPANP
jgi:hypothetical protein